MRSTKSPIAAMNEMKAAQRAVTSVGVAAVSESDGILNCGAGPGFGPTANVNAPRTGCPSTEITRQTTRYQPCASLRSGTSSSSGFAGERSGRPVVCDRASASVTETIAKRGSTASEYTSATCFGDVLTTTLADGRVRSSAACANAAAGSVSAASATAASTSERLIAPAA